MDPKIIVYKRNDTFHLDNRVNRSFASKLNSSGSNFLSHKLLTTKLLSQSTQYEDIEENITKNINLLTIRSINFKLDNKWEYGTSGFMKNNIWVNPSKIFSINNVEKLENLLNNLKYLHPNKENNTYFGREHMLPCGEILKNKHRNGCSYICINFNMNSQLGLSMTNDMFYLCIKTLILFLVSQSYEINNKEIYESICCLESLCKVHRLNKNRKNFSLKIWKLNGIDTLTVIEHIIKIFNNCKIFHSEHVKYFCEVIGGMLELTNKFKDKYEKYERVIQRNKFNKMNDQEITDFKNICEGEDYQKFTKYVTNTLVGIKIKNYEVSGATLPRVS